MVKHSCTKEAEIATLKTDNQWIKEEMVRATGKIDKMLEILTTGEGKISKINKTIYGNGDREHSISYKVEHNSDYILSQKAQWNLLKGGIFFLGASNIFLILKWWFGA